MPCYTTNVGWDTSPSRWAQLQPWSCFQNSKPDSLLKMEEEQRLEKSPLAGNKDKFSFSFSNRKLLGYVSAWAGLGVNTQMSHVTYMPPRCTCTRFMPNTHRHVGHYAWHHTHKHIHCIITSTNPAHTRRASPHATRVQTFIYHHHLAIPYIQKQPIHPTASCILCSIHVSYYTLS